MLEALYVFFRVLAIGMGVIITQLLGGYQVLRVRHTSLAGLGACTWVGAALALFLLFGSRLILDVLNAPEEIWPIAGPFLQLLAPVALLDGYNLTMAAILRAHLHARDSLHVMVVMHLTHMLLAVPLMLGVQSWDGFGLNGFAIALLISRAVGLGLHLLLWRRRMDLTPVRRDWWALNMRVLMPVLRIGLPGASSELGYRIGFMVSLATAARLGVAALATHSYVLQLLRYVFLISLSIGWACEIMVGRLIGAGRFKQADDLVKKALRNGMIASCSMALLAAIASPWLMRIFTKDPEIVHAAQILLWISVLLEAGRVFNLVVQSSLRATGDVIYPVVAGIGSHILVLGVGSYLMGRWFGLPGIFIVYAVDEWVRGSLMLLRWRWRGWLRSARAAQREVRAG